MRLISISRVGRAIRITIMGTSVCPPAMTRALSSDASIAQASSTLATREYSNGAAFMTVCGAFKQNMTWLEFLWCDFNRQKLGGMDWKKYCSHIYHVCCAAFRLCN